MTLTLVTSGKACQAGESCRAGTRVDDGCGALVWQPAPDDGRGLCFVCEQHGRWTLAQLPRVYADLRDELAKDGGRNMSPRFGGGGAGIDPPAPLSLTVDSQLREIEWLVQVWATAVWDRAGGSGASPDEAHWPVLRCTRLLERYFTALLVLGPTLFTPYAPDEPDTEPVEMDGVQGALQLADLYRRARSWVGESRRVEARHMPCPPQWAGGCAREGTLLWEAGTDGVWCSHCGWTCTDADYTGYASMMLVPGARQVLSEAA